MSTKKVAIITLFYKNYNYGAILQAYALQREIEKIGYECEVINLDRSVLSVETIKRISKNIIVKAKKILTSFLPLKRNRVVSSQLSIKRARFETFMKDHVKQTESVYNCNNIKKLIPLYDIFVSGSDQVWSPISGRPETFLSFVPPSKLKVAYAASIGADTISQKYADYIKPMLERYDAISVREQRAKEIVDEILQNKDSVVSLDPTLLLQSDEWDMLAKPVRTLENKNYVLLYYIGEADNGWYQGYDYAKSGEMEIVNIAYNKMSYSKRDYEHSDILYYDVGPGEFLWLIKNAKCILTDSFHGTVFSIIYHKPFYVCKRDSENINGSMNGRIDNLLSVLGIPYNLIMIPENGDAFLIGEKIDYTDVDKNLEILKNVSKRFLKENLDREACRHTDG
ncbi:MAG: polysaccharide pyruvyl transferase family protein [Lachnospiraceae bacterium]|nr:polysaccharide pyruvyl transferase family protein [Lachnospiraceae bacterium]